MGKRKEARYYKGRYLQGNMPDERAEAVLRLQGVDEVEQLTHIITNMPEAVIVDYAEKVDLYMKEHNTLSGFDHEPWKSQAGVGTLKPKQTVGAAFLYYAESALLGDEVGLGKTVEVAATVAIYRRKFKEEGKTFRYLFLGEAAAAGQLRSKLMQFTGEYVGLLPSATAGKISKYVEQNSPERQYSMVGTHALMDSSEFLIHSAKYPFDLVIIDESRTMKKATRTRYKNMKELFKYIPRRILLNATPVEQNLREFYTQLALLDPDYMPSVADFEHTFVVRDRQRRDKSYKNEEVFKRIISLRYLARNREDAGARYEDNQDFPLLIELSSEQKRLLKLTSLDRMVVDYPTGIDKAVPFNEETTPKLAASLHILEEEINAKENRTIMYCYYKECQWALKEVLEEKGYTVAVLNGEITSQKVRDTMVNTFNQGGYDVFITNIQRGLDLKGCDHTIVYSIDPNPQMLVQVEGRMTRELDIVGKRLFILIAMGKEKKRVEDVMKRRIEASQKFTRGSRSMLATALTQQGRKKKFKLPEHNEEQVEAEY